MIANYNFEFCCASIYEDYILVIMNEGITVLPEHNELLISLADKHFNDSKFVYITHRIHSYSVNPDPYLSTSKIKNLIGFAVVSDDPKQQNLVVVEKTFFQKPFKKFNTLEAALHWKDEIIQKSHLSSQ